MEGHCTLFFEDPYWVGIFERWDDAGGYSVARFVFGSEPSAAAFHQFILQEYSHLVFSQPAPVTGEPQKEAGYKRRQREARRATEPAGAGTWAQRALQQERERNKQARKTVTREMREAETAEKYQRRQERKKQKHRGR